ILSAVILFATIRVQASLKVSTDFESGSAKVLSLDEASQSVRITPAGDLNRGMPNWWFLRVDGLDAGKPLALEVTARKVSLPGEGATQGKTLPFNLGWTFPMRAAISTDGTNWSQTSAGTRQGDSCVYRIAAPSSTLWLAWGPPFTPKYDSDFIRG